MNAITGIIAIVFGIAYGIQSYGLPRATIGSPMAPIYFPIGLAGFMVLFGFILFITEATKGNLKAKGKKENIKFTYTGKLITYTCAVSIIYAQIFEEIGFVISTFLFMAAILFVVNGKEKWLTNTIVSVSFSVGLYILFAKLFGISLPPIPVLLI